MSAARPLGISYDVTPGREGRASFDVGRTVCDEVGRTDGCDKATETALVLIPCALGRHINVSEGKTALTHRTAPHVGDLRCE